MRKLDAPSIDRLRDLEERLLASEVRASPAVLDALLDEEFLEIGASGRTFDKRATIALLAAEAPVARTLRSFEARVLAPGVVLVTYRVTRHANPPHADPPFESLRSSVWRERDGDWRLVFHQGTPAPR
jgi:hypothetical protein